MDYSSSCPCCKIERNDINNYFCLKNRGFCENCFSIAVRAKNKVKKKLRKVKKPTPFEYWNHIRRYDEPVDKKRIKNS